MYVLFEIFILTKITCFKEAKPNEIFKFWCRKLIVNQRTHFNYIIPLKHLNRQIVQNNSFCYAPDEFLPYS